MPASSRDRRPGPADGARLLAGLEQLATAVSAAADAASVGRCVVEVARRTLDADRGAVYAVRDGRVALVHAEAAAGDPADGIPGERRLTSADPLAGAALAGGVQVFDGRGVAAAAVSSLVGRSPRRAGTVALLALGRTGSAAGAVALGWPGSGAVTGSGRSFLETISRVASQAMERIVAGEQAQRRAEGLSRTLAAVAGESRPGDVAAVLLRESMPAADAEFGAVRLVSADGLTTTLVTNIGYAQPLPYPSLPTAEHAPSTDAIRLREPVLLPGPEAIANQYPAWAATFDALGQRATASVPIMAGGRPIGSLTLGWREPQAFDPGQLAHVRALADAASVALERARATEEEGRIRQLLAETLRQLPVGVIVAEPTAGLVFQSDEVARLLGGPLPLGPLGGLNLGRTLPDGTPLPLDEWPIARALQGESIEGFESLVRRYDNGREIRLVSSARPVLRDGRVSAAVSVFDDVTDARAAADARDAFLGVLSHELRTPLTSVYGGALVLAKHRDEVPSTFEPVVTSIADDAARLLRLVEDLLVLARIERGAELASPETVSLAPALRRATRAEAERWPGLTVTIGVDEATPPVLADEGPLEVVVRNLVGNAAKYGARHVEVTAASDGDRVAIRVADDGPGLDLPPSELFQLFRRGPVATRRASGSGIGLYVCQALVHAMHGEIAGGNRPGGGAEFTVLLSPAADDDP